MSVVATLLKQVPAAAKFKSKLVALEKELAQFINQWETLDGPQLNALQYLAAHARGHAADIAQSAQMNIQIAETSLVFLRQYDYVNAYADGGKPARGENRYTSCRPRERVVCVNVAFINNRLKK